MPLILNGTTGVSGIDGSAGTPSYVGGDSDTGLWYPAANTLALSTSGSERLRIDSSGNVGIGTSSPSDSGAFTRALDLNGASGAAYYARTNGSATNWTAFGNYGVDGYITNRANGVLRFATNNTEYMRIASGGNVLVGSTTDDGFKFKVVGGNASNFLVDNGGQQYTQILLQRNSTGNTGGDILIDGSASTMNIRGLLAGAMTFQTSASAGSPVERMRITSGGYVGIGTINPVNILDIAGEGQSGVNAINFTWSTTSTGYAPVLNLKKSNGSKASPTAVSNGDQTGAIVFNGYDGSSYQSTAYIESRVDGTSGANDMPGRLVFFTTPDGSASPTERMRIDSGGTVFVNTTGLTYGGRLQVFEGGSNRAASFQTTANDQSILTRCSNASFSNTVQYVTADRAATSSYNFMQLVSSGTGDNEFVFRGDGNGYADGTWNNNGADYAEFFESATGQAISVGSTVVLENNKVRLATESDNPADVIGVVRPKEPSKASMVVGNTAWNKWANKYLTDDFDRYIMEDHDVVEWTDADGKQHSYESHNIPEDITVPADAIIKTHDDKGIKFQHYKLNPAWDPNAEYVNRENRDEWLIIGLVGQVKVFKGQVMGERWRKMRDVSSSVEEWFIR